MFRKTVTMDGPGFLQQLPDLLDGLRIRYCVIGGQGVNAYVEPVVGLDLDLVAAADQPGGLESSLSGFRVSRFPHSLNIAHEGSDLRGRIRLDPRYAEFDSRAESHEVLGIRLPVASIGDVLQGKIRAATDSTRRASKRQKDLADISRLIEAHPELRRRVPDDVVDKRL